MAKETTSAGIGFSGLLQLAFIVLKLCKVIRWSWWCVMLPTIVNIGIIIVCVIVLLVLKMLDEHNVGKRK